MKTELPEPGVPEAPSTAAAPVEHAEDAPETRNEDRLFRVGGQEHRQEDGREDAELDCSGAFWWRRVVLQRAGPVVRHAILQNEASPDAEASRTRRHREDSECTAGLRDPAGALRRLPGSIERTRDLFCIVRRARAASSVLQGLHLAGGSSPSRPPPTERVISEVRRHFATCLGITPACAELHHPAAPWRYELFRALAELWGDSDQEVPRWLKEGAPMGLAATIQPGGHFPRLTEPAALQPDALEPLCAVDVNHPSLHTRFDGDPEAAGWALVRKAVEDGYGEVFSDSIAAETALGGTIYPAPLGTVSKQRTDGTWKHRLIQDLRANQVNAAVELPERMVLPRPLELAVDLAQMGRASGPGDETMIGIIDFSDAFMSVPLAGPERRYNCAALPRDIRRARAPLHPREPETGRVIAWRVLGFGGRPNPLVFGRLTAVLMRLGQAILTARRELQGELAQSLAEESDAAFADAAARAHLYVDDAAIALCGGRAEIEESFDLLLIVWLIMGAPISWPKVALTPIAVDHPARWIGVDFSLDSGAARMRLPPDFVQDLLQQLREIRAKGGHISDADAARLVGRAGRVAFVVPSAAPFAASLRTALDDARRTARTRRRQEQRGSHAVQRFSTAAAWFEALLCERPVSVDGPLPLERVIWAEPPGALIAGECDAILFDASLWGGGAVLVEGRTPRQWIATEWSDDLCQELRAERGQSAYLSFFEAFTVLAAVALWCQPGQRTSVAVVGDNIAALTVAVSRRGRGDLGRLCRELALVQAHRSLSIAVGHLASELNTWADSLSRLSAPSPSTIPKELLEVPRATWPRTDELFRIRPGPPAKEEAQHSG